MKEPLTYTGGLASTNAYLLDLHGHLLAIDAPEGFLDFLKKKKMKPHSLLLTHGHWDHIWDAADLVDWAGCPVSYHPDTAPLCLQPDSMLAFGLPQRLRPIQATHLLTDSTPPPASWPDSQLLHVPGHCPGSLCLYLPQSNQLFGGDVLFADGVGRWDLPGGSRELLITGIQKKILPLPPQTIVYPGHGPTTTIGREKSSNPFLQT
ncbi:MAG TPA: Zn-dependent hydrolase [Verrucomicrobia subdivision 6 bacterium]|nr:Zn-dependent hydrolase [Verrucomicrobia subdivision 6 bacterium]